MTLVSLRPLRVLAPLTALLVAGAPGLAAGTPAGAAPASVRGPGNLFATTAPYADPAGPAALDAAALAPSDPAGAAAERWLAGVGVADWFAGRSAADVGHFVDKRVTQVRAAGRLPMLVTYDVPGRDCGHYSAGGAASDADYRAWIRGFAAGIGGRQAAVIVEPDALAHLDTCLTADQQAGRLALLRDAVTVLAARPWTAVYLDAGAPGWHSPALMAQRLRDAGVDGARGFALDVSDTKTDAATLAFGHAVSDLLGGVPFLVDSSRNGSGPFTATPGAPSPYDAEPWCNPPGRTLGRLPTGRTGDPGVDAFLWVKNPGQSDGPCGRGDPPSGAWNRAYAVDLVTRSLGPAGARSAQ